MSVNLGDNLGQRGPGAWDNTYKSPSLDNGAPFPRRPPLPFVPPSPSLSSLTRPFIPCIHSCNLAAAMDSGVNMGEILGPVVLAVVINVSPSPPLDRAFHPGQPHETVHAVRNLRRAVVQLLYFGLQRSGFHKVRPI